MRALSRAYRYQFDCPIPAEIIIDAGSPLTKEEQFKVAEQEERKRDVSELQATRAQEREWAIREEVNEERVVQLYFAIRAKRWALVGPRERDVLAARSETTFGSLAGAIIYRNLLLMAHMNLCEAHTVDYCLCFAVKSPSRLARERNRRIK